MFAHKEVPSEEVYVEKALQKSLSVSKVELKLLWGGMTMYHIEDLPFDIKVPFENCILTVRVLNL